MAMEESVSDDTGTGSSPAAEGQAGTDHAERNSEAPRGVFRVAVLAENSAFEYSGGRYYSWIIAEALAHAGHDVQYVTNNLPVFYTDFATFPHHRDVKVCLMQELGSRRLAKGPSGDIQLTPAPVTQPLAASRKSFLKEEMLGEELAVLPSAAARAEWETGDLGVLRGTYGANLSVEEPTEAVDGSRWCLRVASAGVQSSGIYHPSARVPLKGGRSYLIECDLFSEQARTAFRLGVKSDTSGNLWAVDLGKGMIDFSNEAGRWTHMTGILSLPPGDHPSQLWLMHWDKQELSWLLDNVSVREILTSTPVQIADFGEELQERKWSDPGCARRRKAQEESLAICAPFMPNSSSDASPLSYYFVDPDQLDLPSIRVVADEYAHVFLEEEIARRLEAEGSQVPPSVTRVPALSAEQAQRQAPPRVLFLASNDTHVHYMLRVAEYIKDFLFVIPKPSCKDEGAGARLREHDIPYIEVDYRDCEKPEIEAFRPDLVLSGNDWTSEFIAIKRIMARLGVPCIALQEGPQDWDQKIKGVNPRKYRNCDLLFAQGSVTLKYIRPKYFAVTGNPKTDHIEPQPMPERPRLFINCNFTYGQYEECRQEWVADVLEVCRELGLDYIISKHPRDVSEWDDPNLVRSSSFTIPDQMRSCSIIISRFSNISYEALTYGRPSIYYNPHREPMKTFNEDNSGGIINVYDRGTLKEVLARHQQAPRFDEASALDYMARHCGPMDRDSIGRVVRAIGGLVSRRLCNNDLVARLGRELIGGDHPLFTVLICTYNRSDMLDRAIHAVLTTHPGDIPYELLVVDNASTDGTREVVQRYQERHDIRYIFEPRLGLSTARNTGWQNARGDYVVFLDDDGEPAQGWLQAFLDVFETQPDAVAVGGRIIAQYERPKPAWVQGVSERYYGEYNMGNDVILTDWVPGGNSAWRRDVLKALGGFDPRFGRVGSNPSMGSEESVLIKRAREQGGQLFYSPRALMYHNVTKSKQRITWLAHRHYGQGKTQMRWGIAFSGGWTRKRAAWYGLRRLAPLTLLALRLFKHSVLLHSDRVITILFQFLHELGKAVEAALYATGRLKISPTARNGGVFDIVILVPNNRRDPILYDDVRDFARARHAKLVLLNFETPNWFNILSPVKRDEALWDNWKRIAPDIAMVLSISAEGERYAREFFSRTPPTMAFEYCHPCINTVVADALPHVPREKRIVLVTRAIRGEHKGFQGLSELVTEAMRGYTLVMIVGAGDIPQAFRKDLEKRCAVHGVELAVRYRITDREKFMEIKQARLMLFPSLFEGFGLPPLESLYCNTPCVAFDLPVLREVFGENLIYARHGDWADFRAVVARVLSRLDEPSPSDLSKAIAQVARFEHYVKRIDDSMQKLMSR